jgi:hypothetical protein
MRPSNAFHEYFDVVAKKIEIFPTQSTSFISYSSKNIHAQASNTVGGIT